MQLNKSIKNIIFGFLSQIVTIVLAIFIPRLFITGFGSEMNGLISSITQILVYFGLFEAGVGTATLVALYGPVAKDDKQSVNEILSATSIYYKKTGIVYFIALLFFSIVYPILIPTGIDTTTIRCIILLTGLADVINYFFQGKFCILLQAEGKNYIMTNVRIVVNILTGIAKIILLMRGFNVIAVQSTFAIFNSIQMLYIYYYIKKNYQWLDLNVKPDYEAISKKSSVLVHQFSALIFSNTDIIILTIFTDLKVVSVYALYTLLFGAIGSAISNISSGVAFILGQEFNKDKNKYIKIHDVYELGYLALVFALYTIAFIFILPFLKLYTVGITDISYIDQYLPVLFVLTYLLSNARATSSQVIIYAGHFKETMWRSILESGINITCSILFVYFLGIYGVLLGTVIALLYRTNDLIIYANKHILARSPWITYRRVLLDSFLLFVVVFVSSRFAMASHTYMQIFGWAFVYCITVIPLFIVVNLLCEREVFKNSVLFLKPYVRRILKLS